MRPGKIAVPKNVKDRAVSKWQEAVQIANGGSVEEAISWWCEVGGNTCSVCKYISERGHTAPCIISCPLGTIKSKICNPAWDYLDFLIETIPKETSLSPSLRSEFIEEFKKNSQRMFNAVQRMPIREGE